jgi:hypothetical protein
MTPAKQRRAGRLALLEHIRAHAAVVDEGRLATMYSACDVVINAAVIGESQGVAIAEAMALGIPVVTCSTPWVDNAQVEMVDHGVNGWVANHPRPFAEAIADLLLDEQRRRQFGNAGTAKIGELLDPVRLTRQLENLYDHHLGARTGALTWTPDAHEIEQFAAEYPLRAVRQFRPLSPRERAEAEYERTKDRMRQLRSSALMLGSGLFVNGLMAVRERAER